LADLINLGAFVVNTLSDNSSAAGHDSNYGNLQKVKKLNQGFGTVLGSANLIMSCFNFVFDPDVADTVSLQSEFDPSVAPGTIAF
jgi:hypothetical protein